MFRSPNDKENESVQEFRIRSVGSRPDLLAQGLCAGRRSVCVDPLYKELVEVIGYRSPSHKIQKLGVKMKWVPCKPHEQ